MMFAAGASKNAQATVHGTTHSLCGVERWTVKTLQDRPRLLPLRTVPLRYLVTRPAPGYLPSTRLPFERHIYRVIAAVTLIRHEDDDDFHLVLRDHGQTMIAETPALGCTTRATPLRRRQMQRARNAVRLCARAAVTGVAFFDFDHGQTGVAPNAIELHPRARVSLPDELDGDGTPRAPWARTSLPLPAGATRYEEGTTVLTGGAGGPRFEV
jgi:hypothetical protein